MSFQYMQKIPFHWKGPQREDIESKTQVPNQLGRIVKTKLC